MCAPVHEHVCVCVCACLLRLCMCEYVCVRLCVCLCKCMCVHAFVRLELHNAQNLTRPGDICVGLARTVHIHRVYDRISVW